MNHEIIVKPEAEDDILDAFIWNETRDPGLGTRYVKELDAAFIRISREPGSYPEVVNGIRKTVTHKFPFLIFYCFDTESVFILAVLHAAQDHKRFQNRIGSQFE